MACRDDRLLVWRLRSEQFGSSSARCCLGRVCIGGFDAIVQTQVSLLFENSSLFFVEIHFAIVVSVEVELWKY